MSQCVISLCIQSVNMNSWNKSHSIWQLIWYNLGQSNPILWTPTYCCLFIIDKIVKKFCSHWIIDILQFSLSLLYYCLLSQVYWVSPNCRGLNPGPFSLGGCDQPIIWPSFFQKLAPGHSLWYIYVTMLKRLIIVLKKAGWDCSLSIQLY